MTEPEDPPRIVDPNSGASDRLKRLVEQSRADVGSETELRALGARLSPLLWPAGGAIGTSGAGPGGAIGAHATVPFVAKIGVALVLAGAGGVWLSSKHEPEGRPPSGTVAAPVVAERVASSAAPPGVAAAAIEITDGAAETKPLAVHDHRNIGADGVSESDLLGRAQSLLLSDPTRALALTEKYRRLFGHGVLVQECEVIAIDALTRLGRRAEAVARAQRFLKAFPNSAHRNKIQSLIGSG